jgi:A/G-specific adenine glycosylase
MRDDVEAIKSRFRRGLLTWNKKHNKRIMPWKGEKDPYRIWLSEIILQQTRVEQGLKYYESFILTFPTVKELANAPSQKVFKLWEGLGYYSRCKNLITSAQYISEVLGGKFPNDYDSILALKGVGAYTASAIASFAFDLPHAVLDGNVFRVLSRAFGIETPIDTPEGRKLFSDLAQSILPPDKPALYNQAIMDFGATICKPQPDCAACFFKENCNAFKESKQLLLPVKSKRLKVSNRWFNYIVFRSNDHYAIRERTTRDVWQSLFEFHLVETDKKPNKRQVQLQLEQGFNFNQFKYTITGDPFSYSQRLSHQLIHFQIYLAEINDLYPFQNFRWVPREELKNYPFPKTLLQFIKEALC